MNLEQYLQAHYSGHTVKSYKRWIEMYVAHYTKLSGDQSTALTARYKDITAFLGVARQRYKNPTTISRLLCAIRVYYEFLCDAGLRPDNPSLAIRLKDRSSRDIQLQDLFTTQQLEALLTKKERYPDQGCKNRVLISLFIYQALFPGEAAALTVGDINLEAGTIYIKPGRETNGRTLSLKPRQILLFHQYITVSRPKLLKKNKSDKLLIGQRGKPMPPNVITAYILGAFNRWYGNKKINAQTIRQSVITNLLKQGHDISLIQAFAGHKNPSSTEKYQQNEIETLQAAVNKYHPLK
jgi:integrase/recombinase XerD